MTLTKSELINRLRNYNETYNIINDNGIYCIHKTMDQLIQSKYAELQAKSNAYFQQNERTSKGLDTSQDIRSAAVLIGLFQDHKTGDWHVLLTRRSSTMNTFPSIVALPGGNRDDCDASLVYTAIREATEEIHVSSSQIDPIIILPPLQVGIKKRYLTVGVVAIISPAVTQATTQHIRQPSNTSDTVQLFFAPSSVRLPTPQKVSVIEPTEKTEDSRQAMIIDATETSGLSSFSGCFPELGLFCSSENDVIFSIALERFLEATDQSVVFTDNIGFLQFDNKTQSESVSLLTRGVASNYCLFSAIISFKRLPGFDLSQCLPDLKTVNSISECCQSYFEWYLKLIMPSKL